MAKFISSVSLLLLIVSTTVIVVADGNCGQKKVIAQQFISHGYKALAGSWPWHGAMFHRYQRTTGYACGVTVISELFVITAAHCTIDPNERQRLPASRVFIKVGLTNLDASEKHAQQHDVVSIIRHEGYDDSTFEDDISLMKLYTEITYSSYVQPICLWQGDKSLAGVVKSIGYLVGWGLDENFGLPKDLNEATVPIVSKKQCLESDPEHYTRVYHEPKTFCGGYQNGTAAGPGDSGGGLFIRKGNHWLLRGIVSNGRTDPNTLHIDSTSYVMFTDVAYYLEWIMSELGIKPGSTSDDKSVILPVPSSQPTAPEGFANLLGIEQCGLDKNPIGTPEELKQLLNQYPWLAVVEYLNLDTRLLEDVCHAILIHPRFLVTTSRCVLQRRQRVIRSVRLNDYRLDSVTDIFNIDGKTVQTTAERVAVNGISTHLDYNNPTFANNIALIKLSSSTTFTPICLPPIGSQLPTDKTFSIVGWKKTTRSEKPMIRNVVQVVDFPTCSRKYEELDIRLDASGGQVCSTYNHFDGDGKQCSHYMGAAPFQYVKNGASQGRYFLAGISSLGHTDCKKDDIPDVFTNIVHYGQWIRDKVTANA